MTTEPNTITDKQRNFITNLLTQREVPAHVTRTLNDVPVEALSKQSASEIIGELLNAPEKAKEQQMRIGEAVRGAKDDLKANNYGIPSGEDLPSGRYAIDNADGELTFYRVWRGTRNPDYVKLYVLHGPDESEVPFKSMVTILKKIAENPGAAAVRYGHEIGACSQCGLRLTNRVSRALGIGPICGGHFYGEEFKSVVHGAREQIRAAGLDPDGNVEDDEVVARYDINGDFTPPADDTPQRDVEGLIRMPALLDDLDERSNAEIESIIAVAERILEKRAFAAREAQQERAAYEAKMERDQGFLGR